MEVGMLVHYQCNMRVVNRVTLVCGSRGETRGGPGTIVPCQSILAPHRKLKSDFLEIVGICSTLKTIF